MSAVEEVEESVESVESVEAVEADEQDELSEEDIKHQNMLKEVMIARQSIAQKLNGQKISDAFITIIQRAEMHSMVHGVDYYVTTVENGIAFFNEEQYNKLVEKTIADLRLYLAKQKITEESMENEVDSYAANLVIHYVDFKSFTDEEIQSCRTKFSPQKIES